MQEQEEAPTLEEWDEVMAQPVSIEELDGLVAQMMKAWTKVEEASEVVKGLRKEYDKLEARVLATLESAKKSKYYVDGFGTAYIKSDLQVRVPANKTEKKKLFDYIQEELGDDVLFNLLSINSATLKKFVNDQAAVAAEKGVANFTIPGLQPPTVRKTLGFKSAK